HPDSIKDSLGLTGRSDTRLDLGPSRTPPSSLLRGQVNTCPIRRPAYGRLPQVKPGVWVSRSPLETTLRYKTGPLPGGGEGRRNDGSAWRNFRGVLAQVLRRLCVYRHVLLIQVSDELRQSPVLSVDAPGV
ncbi:MAG: hypothetical protein LC776_11980, partial [Acidobacteria bacterium]|nr:hypothetical protein [Acidobacteriota bacterium]